jgi:hypothetical protein
VRPLTERRLEAAGEYREVHKPTSVSASYHGAFERLEPDEVNISSPVLRGRRTGNSPLLPALLKTAKKLKQSKAKNGRESRFASETDQPGIAEKNKKAKTAQKNGAVMNRCKRWCWAASL